MTDATHLEEVLLCRRKADSGQENTLEMTKLNDKSRLGQWQARKKMERRHETGLSQESRRHLAARLDKLRPIGTKTAEKLRRILEALN